MMKRTIFYVTLILALIYKPQGHATSPSKEDLFEISLAVLRLPINIAQHNDMNDATTKKLLLSQDGVRIASGLVGICRHTYNKYNLAWLIKDLFSLVSTLQKSAEECRMQVALSPGSSACYLIESAACAASALCNQSNSLSEVKAHKRFLLLQGLASLARTAQYFTAEAEFSPRAQAAFALTALHFLLLLSDSKPSLDEVPPLRPAQQDWLTQMMSNVTDITDNPLGDNPFFNEAQPDQEPIQFDSNRPPEVTYSRDNGITIIRQDNNSNRHEIQATERTNDRIAPGGTFVILPCNHIFTSRQAERYTNRCGICQHKRPDISENVTLHNRDAEWWGQLPNNNNGNCENIPLERYTQEAREQLAEQRGEELNNRQLNL